VGLFFNQTLPSTVGGDVARWWYAYRSGIPALPAFNGLLLDRIIGMLMLAVFTLAMAPIVGNNAERFTPSWVLYVLLATMVSGVAAVLLVDRLPADLARFRLLNVAMRLASDSRRVLLRLRHTPLLLILSAVAQLLLVVAVYLLADTLEVRTSFAVCLFVVPAALLFAALPVSLGGWGVREGAFIFGFGLFGVGATDALAVSLLFGVASMLAGLPGGMVWWFTRGGGGTHGRDLRSSPAETLAENETIQR